MKKLCIYHGNCADGFTAAWVVRQALGEDNVEFHAGIYGDPPPDVTGRDVILVDFSYKRPVLAEMIEKARRITILDHHKSAMEDLSGFGEGDDRACVVFDMEHSGAMLAWLYFFPGREPPALVRYVEDRDLWLFLMKGSRAVNANIFSHAYSFAGWDEINARLNGTAAYQFVREGEAIERKHFKDVRELVEVGKRRMRIGGHDVPVVNLPYTMASDAGHLLAQGEPFAAIYYDKDGARVFSLRSADDGLDVSKIASQYGGGGHAHAAGFRAPAGWEGDAA